MFLSLPRILPLVLALMLPAYGDDKPAENAKSAESAENGSIVTETATESTPAPLKDVNNFDISGVKLGMTWDEARTAIKENLKITDNEIKVSGSARLLVSGKEVPNVFSVKKGDDTIEVRFMPNALHDKPDELAVESVKYETSARNWDTYLDAAIQKYGKPEFGGESAAGKTFAWCNRCASRLDYPSLTFGQEFSNLKIQLWDPHYMNAQQEFEDRGKDKTPKF